MPSKMLYGTALGKVLPDASVDAIVTSPPFFGLRAYGNSDMEIGRNDLNQYLVDMSVFAERMFHALKDTGTFWLNLGDTASGSGGAGGDFTAQGSKRGVPRYKQGLAGIPKGQWCMVPERVALILQTQGWLLRSAITWDKQNLRPESAAHTRRPGVSSERIFMFVKSKEYVFNHEVLQEPDMDRGDVWHFPPYRGKRAHQAPFPDELPRRCIALSTAEGDTVFDPFAGSGTTLRVAEAMNRNAIGLDLYKYDDDIVGVPV